VYIRKVLFVGKLVLLLLLGYVLVTKVIIPQRTGGFFQPSTADGIESVDIAEPANLPRASAQGYSTIIEHNLFSDTALPIGPVNSAGNQAAGASGSVEKLLGLRLLGTVAGDTLLSRAIIKNLQNDDVDLYRTGDTVAAARIESIEDDSVVVLYQGKRKKLNLGIADTTPHKADNPQPASQKNKTKKAEQVKTDSSQKPSANTRAKLADIETMLEKAVIRPYTVDGQMEGLRITGLDKVPYAKSIGLKDGDIIKTVNGHRLTSKQKAYQVFKKARSQPKPSRQRPGEISCSAG